MSDREEEMAIRKLPVGIQSFEDLRRNGYVYVDKTEYIRKLVETGKVYFLSRPRRFGKSLFISTLEAYFQGKKDLFRGLTIEPWENRKGDKAWAEYPVIRFSLSGGQYQEPEGLKNTLRGVLGKMERRYGISSDPTDLSNRFRNLIEQLNEKTGRQVVVLVDEYDKPLLETMVVNEEQEERNRQLYKGFFSVLKDEDQYLKFVFFTGVTKFSKVSVFSDLNQLRDISLVDEYSGICGITEGELTDCFSQEIQSLASKMKVSPDECEKKLAFMYDGYRFSPEGTGVYNPFSLLNAFNDGRLRRYWFETGTPKFVIEKLELSNYTPEQFTDGVEADESSLMDYRAENANPLPLLYQSGYLTIRDYDEEFGLYTLGFPNNEVQYGFLNSLVPSVLGRGETDSPYSAKKMVLALRRGDLDTFMGILESVFARIPYEEGKQHTYEQEWRNEVYLIFMLMGENARCEVHSAGGRVDCIVETKDYVYLFEFKLDKSADEALAQIEDKGYAAPYKADPRKVLKIGVNFQSEKRNIGEWKTAQ